jgi:hypothetical protein
MKKIIISITTVFLLLIFFRPVQSLGGVEIVIEGRDLSPARGSFEYETPEVKEASEESAPVLLEKPVVAKEKPASISLKRETFKVTSDSSIVESPHRRLRLKIEDKDKKDNSKRNIIRAIFGVIVVGALAL